MKTNRRSAMHEANAGRNAAPSPAWTAAAPISPANAGSWSKGLILGEFPSKSRWAGVVDRNSLHQPFGLRAASRHLLRCRSSAMSPHRLRRGASHLPARRPQRKSRDFRSTTLVIGAVVRTEELPLQITVADVP